MSWIVEFFRSVMGKKAIMAASGVMLFGFVLTHMLGNLKIYTGPEKLNAYSEHLRELGAPILDHGQALWGMRLGLIAAVLLHMYSAWSLTMLNRKARPQKYAKTKHLAATYASRTMRWGGVIIVLFTVYHILHLTLGSAHGDFKAGDVFHNVVSGFTNPLVSGVYILAVAALGLHLHHGLWSMFQSLGLSGPRIDPLRQAFSVSFAVIVALGYIAVPISVLLGIVTTAS